MRMTMKEFEQATKDAELLFNYVLIQAKDAKVAQSICNALLPKLAEWDLVKLKTNADKLLMFRATMKKR